MSQQSELLLLDTNILVHLVRGNSLGRWLEEQFAISSRTERPLISVVTIGEALALGKKFAWGQARIETLEALFSELVVLDINSEVVLRAYAEIDHRLSEMGNPIQHNDMWIAATAVAAQAHLLTTDRDFDALHPSPLTRTWIDPRRPLQDP
ncbi:MAG: tRNA(fMet)-specific endonuclease VapC [Acidobacteriota bacterium]|nr:tRNA(fMet)-specific endonuclease VapC [Acidobacteriota bacterium]